MNLNDLPLTELLKLTATETDVDRLKQLVEEISHRYEQQDPHMVFDIFSGIDDRDAIWLKAVVGLRAANERMRQIAANAPGTYFIFHSQSRKVMARLDNGPLRAAEPRKPPKTGTDRT